ncbi:MAG: recombination mediator RecR, partial [Saezia sp.]
MSQKSALDKLIAALQCLPGVGVKSAQRMAYQLLQSNRQGALHLAQALQDAVEHTGHCKLCHTLSQNELCDICDDAQRDAGLLCVVESPADQLAMEKTCTYNGLYYILMGRLSPLDGIGPDEIGLQQLYNRVLDSGVREVILATNFTA